MDLFNDFFVFDIPGEIIISLCVMAVIAILSIIVFFLARKADPKEEHKGLLGLFEMVIEKVEGLVHENMGDDFPNFGGFVLSAGMFIIFSFIVGITGLPGPMTYLGVTLTLGLCTFVFIHATSVRYTKWGYFKRYIDPIPVFLPVNLISMWSPLLSLSLRLFGNAVSGWVLLSIVYWALENASSALFSMLPDGINGVFLAPIIAPFLHLYFDLFSAAIQMFVFIFLSMLFVAQEKPEEVKIQDQMMLANR